MRRIAQSLQFPRSRRSPRFLRSPRRTRCVVVAAVAAVAALAVMSGGCAPWQATGTARPVDEGRWEAGAGFAWLAPQSFRIWEGFPAPQFWVTRGFESRTEVKLTYAPPLSMDARLKWQVIDGNKNALSVHGGTGWISYGGVLDVPIGGLAYGALGATMSHHPDRQAEEGEETGRTRAPFATVEARLPFVRQPPDRTALGVWLTGSVGVEWEAEDLWIAPQLGGIVPVGQRDRWIWLPGIAAGARR